MGSLDLDGNQLSRLQLPAGLTGLGFLDLDGNLLTSFTVPADMTNLSILRFGDNQLSSLTLPAGLTNLSALVLEGNQLTDLTLPADLAKLATLLLDGNPLTTLVLSEPLAATRLAGVVASLRDQGVSVFTYPLAVRLIPRERWLVHSSLELPGHLELTLSLALRISRSGASWALPPTGLAASTSPM